MNILFVSNTKRTGRPYLDPATRYRCYNPAADLRSLGHVADVCSLHNFRMEYVDRYDSFIFHKPPFTRDLEAALALIEKRGKQYRADYDDLIFDPKNALESSLFLTGRASEKIVLDIFERNLQALRLFSQVTVSTLPLGQEVAISSPDSLINVIHNGLSTRWIESARMRYGKRPVHGTISYFSGTRSHDHDFEMVNDLLAQYLASNRNARLRIVGPVDFDSARFPKRQLQRIEAVEYEKLPAFIMDSWINIAPLQDNLFNRCKSGLKFFEAAAFGIPTITSPIPDMQRFHTPGITLAQTSGEWLSGLETLMQEEPHEQAASVSSAYALNHCTSMTESKKLVQALLDGLHEDARPVPEYTGNVTLASAC